MNGALQWKIQLNPDPSKQANEIYFSRESNTDGYLPIKLNDNSVQLCDSSVILVKHLNFHEHIKGKL